MTGKIYKTSKGWFLETKNNHYLPVYPKQVIEDVKIGARVFIAVIFLSELIKLLVVDYYL